MDADLLWNRSSRQRDFNRPRYEHACVQCCLIQKLRSILYPSSSIVQNEVYITISNHNNQRNIREMDADLLWNRSSRQRDFNHPPFYCEFMACIALIIYVFLPSPVQTYSHGMFSLLPLPRLISSQKMRVSNRPNSRCCLIKSNWPPNAVSRTEEACVSRCLIERHFGNMRPSSSRVQNKTCTILSNHYHKEKDEENYCTTTASHTHSTALHNTIGYSQNSVAGTVLTKHSRFLPRKSI